MDTTEYGALENLFFQGGSRNKDVMLEMYGVTHVDSAFVGLVMLLHGYQMQHRRQLQISLLPEHGRRIFKYCYAEFLC